MGVLAFNHFNIRAPRALLEEVKHFYLNVIGLEEGFRPDVPIHGYWLYLEELPVLHLMEWSGIDEPPPRSNVGACVVAIRFLLHSTKHAGPANAIGCDHGYRWLDCAKQA